MRKKAVIFAKKTKRKEMKQFNFKSYDAFLHALDGKVYSVGDAHGRYLCDILEQDYLRLTDAGILIDLDADPYDYEAESECNVMMAFDMGEQGNAAFVDKYGLSITIDEEKRATADAYCSLHYETGTLILKSSPDDQETAFLFLDGIAIEVDSEDSCIPVSHPKILTYPHKNVVLNRVDMREAIEDYQGHPWDGDFYAIALLYGVERKLEELQGIA